MNEYNQQYKQQRQAIIKIRWNWWRKRQITRVILFKRLLHSPLSKYIIHYIMLVNVVCIKWNIVIYLLCIRSYTLHWTFHFELQYPYFVYYYLTELIPHYIDVNYIDRDNGCWIFFKNRLIKKSDLMYFNCKPTWI